MSRYFIVPFEQDLNDQVTAFYALFSGLGLAPPDAITNPVERVEVLSLKGADRLKGTYEKYESVYFFNETAARLCLQHGITLFPIGETTELPTGCGAPFSFLVQTD